MVSNTEFLTAIFGDQYARAHVTSFNFDPAAIPQDKSGLCWGGHPYAARELKGINQYYTVSLFSEPKRRKRFFEATYVVMLDDVKEKLDFEEAQKLPEPSFILETSHGSEQWGYILKTPETQAFRVDNLHDGLVKSGLAPDSKDPGQKGVTRYVRLPEGKNNKKNKLVFGRPFNCRLTLWKPEQTYTLEDVAAPFNIDVDTERKEARVDGACDMPDHPIFEHVTINHRIAAGQYDIVCPWVEEHTARANSGTAIFTNDDMTMGFKCHHGHCEHKNPLDVIEHFDMHESLMSWKFQKSLAEIDEEPVKNPPIPDKGVEKEVIPAFDQMVDQLDRAIPRSKEQKKLAKTLINASKEMDIIDQIDLHKKVKDIMDWNEQQLKAVLKESNRVDKEVDRNFFDEYVFVGQQNKFYNTEKKMWYLPEAFSNMHFDEDAEAKKNALKGLVQKVDQIDYLPKGADIFTEGGIRYANIWKQQPIRRKKGSCQPWLDHFKLLGWDTEHLLKWMAFTIRNPEIKINHGVILGSAEGCVDDQTEYMTKDGWKKFDNYNGEEVLLFDKTTETARFEKPMEYVVNDFNEDFIHITNQNLDMMLTPAHNVLYRDWAGRYRDADASFIHEKICGNQRGYSAKIPSFLNSEESIELSDEMMRFIVMYSADGTTHNNRHKIQVKKERKKERAREILKAAGVEYEEVQYKSMPDYSRFIFTAPCEKGLPVQFYRLSQAQARVVAEELIFWDGSNNNGRKAFYTSKKQEADIAQFVFHAAGFQSNLYTEDRVGQQQGDYVRKSIEYRASAFKGDSKGLADNTVSNMVKSNGKSYCFKTPTGYFYARRNGKVFITGNSGKDWLLHPMKMAMGGNHQTIEGDELLTEYSGYLIGTKYLHVNEVELGDNRDAMKVSNKIKRLLAGPPDTVRVREMWAGAYDVRNVLSISMTTNSRLPLRLREVSRRLYCLWTDFKVKDETGVTTPNWVRYWDKNWAWMENGGAEMCIDYLMQLDISDFNPGASPPVTDWLRQMVSGSENTVIQSLKNWMTHDTMCQGGLMTTTDILNSIEFFRRVNTHLIFCDRITVSMIDLNLRNMGFSQKDGLWDLTGKTPKLVKTNK